MATVFGTSYLINGLYDEVKDATGFENYVDKFEAYNLNDMPENQVMVEATDKSYGAATDALESGKDIAKGSNIRISKYYSQSIYNITK